MITKKYLKTKDVCKVTFYTPSEIEADTVYLVGDFNDWSETATPMKKLKDGRFKVTLELDPQYDGKYGKGEYQFRYLVNGDTWHNDWVADKYVANMFSGDNSVVCV